ncbi:hypothetical protein NCCP2331_23210 [Sporosarcina sp. NCCP-2331]|nr:hypothetical protein NCCP2331_23210 [Sporosarcina sp. NCCP-2331]GLB56224.1 hypothetical protein NCCP2378_20110 [Sporosarcina sp. NCCP-2378]
MKSGLAEIGATNTQHKLLCEVCGEKRWFAQMNPMKERSQLVFVIEKYLVVALLGLVVLANIFVRLGIWS